LIPIPSLNNAAFTDGRIILPDLLLLGQVNHAEN
jgi:hypothetical protein